ncbi:dTDP-glucose 4,6-dehydratase [Patescibacteria group bacterium]|nr:dTDP-glucose 4,6-dehydratase [Patescibacteria group bacterium]MBU0963464.1 dTDP-glucose 4,6-dehydratase [Patescibacteria group bacterium]
MKLLVTGGAGFIGSNFIHYWLKEHPDDSIVNLDCLTYAGNPYTDKDRNKKPANLKDLENNQNYKFENFDITCPIKYSQAETSDEYGRFDSKEFNRLKDFIKNSDTVVHFAAESHVDKSVLNAGPDRPDAYDFVLTNTWGTHIMLEAAVKAWKDSNFNNKRFHHISTDEVFGALALDDPNKFNEQTAYDPRSPYSASKAGADHLVRAYNTSYDLPTTISNTSNNYGPYMYPEKLLPLAITNLLENKKVPIYGDGKYVRDWLYVDDHCQAIDLIIKKGKVGDSYCIGGLTDDINNLELIKKVLKILNKDENSLEYVKDRPGHDRRYAVNWDKAKKELGYRPRYDLDTYLEKMIIWYQKNEAWWKPIKEGEFKEYYKRQYIER